MIIKLDFDNLFVVLPLIASTIYIGDTIIVSWRPTNIPYYYWALLDPFVHVALALLVISPLFFHPPLCKHPFLWVLIASLVSICLDLDHFVAARSFSLLDALSLEVRPISHSLFFAIGCAIVTYLLTLQWSIAWLVFGTLTSHVLRDAAGGGTLFLWPAQICKLPISLYYLAEIGLYLATTMLVNIRSHN